MKTLNDQVALLPLQLGHTEGKTERLAAGLNVSDKVGRTLIEATVAFDSDKFKKGQKLFFRAEITRHDFTRQKMIHKGPGGDQEFILVPENMAVAVEE